MQSKSKIIFTGIICLILGIMIGMYVLTSSGTPSQQSAAADAYKIQKCGPGMGWSLKYNKCLTITKNMVVSGTVSGDADIVIVDNVSTVNAK